MPTPQRLTSTSALAAAAILALAPACAHGNTISIVGGTIGMHLFFGNFLIGVLEGILICWRFKTPAGRSIGLMVAANYASAILGYVFLMISYFIGTADLLLDYRVFLMATILMTIAVFGMTLLFEFPFVHRIFPIGARTFRKSLMALLLANAVSYAGFIGFYWMVSDISLIREFTLVPADQMEAPEGYALFYISPDRMAVMRSDLLGRNAEIIHSFETQASRYGDRLFARPTAEGTYDLYLLTRKETISPDLQLLIQEDFAAAAPLEYWMREYPDEMPSHGFSFAHIPHMSEKRNWKFRVPPMLISGERLSPQPDEISNFKVNFDTPFWPIGVGNASQIEGDFLIFQFGSDSILILQPDSRKLARLTHGQGPLAAKMRPADEQTDGQP